MEQHSSNITVLLRSLRRRIRVLLFCAVLLPAAAFAYSVTREKEYTASASLLFRDPGFDQKLFGAQVFEQSSDPAREAATNVKLVSLETIAKRTGRRLGVESIRDKVHVQAAGQSDVVSVSATDTSPRRAANIANAFAREYISFRREADRSKIAQARALVERRLEDLPPDVQEGPQGRTLGERLDQLDVLASLQTGNAELAETAEVPTDASSPKIVRDTLLGALLGLVLGTGLALLREQLDRRIRDPEEFEVVFERPVLGAIVESRTLARSDGGVGELATGEREAFRMLRANLRYFNVDHQVGSVLVTSAAPGDGKTTVAWNLAATAAEGGGRVLLIEADLRHPSIADGLGLGGAPGLSTALAGQADVDDVIQEISLQDQTNGRGLRTLQVLLSGPLPPNPSDLIESDRMRDLIATAEREYDLVVIDTPPTSVVSDAVPLVKEVGGVIVVGRLGKTTRDAAGHLRTQLENLDAPVLGIVVNALRSRTDGYGNYGYGYGEEASSSRLVGRT